MDAAIQLNPKTSCAFFLALLIILRFVSTFFFLQRLPTTYVSFLLQISAHVDLCRSGRWRRRRCRWLRCCSCRRRENRIWRAIWFRGNRRCHSGGRCRCVLWRLWLRRWSTFTFFNHKFLHVDVSSFSLLVCSSLLCAVSLFIPLEIQWSPVRSSPFLVQPRSIDDIYWKCLRCADAQRESHSKTLGISLP